jgi:AraC family transcriptional regulator
MFLSNYADMARVSSDLSVLLHTRSNQCHIPAHSTSLSLYTAIRGSELHEVGVARYAVTPQRYLILNDATQHAQRLEDNSEVISLRFRAGLGTDIYTAFATPLKKQLEHPDFRLEPLEFYQRTYPQDPHLSQLLGLLRAFIWVGVPQDALEQAIQPILQRLLLLHRNLEPEIERLPAAKRSTREELFRRLHIARDFIEASFLENLDLKGIAEVVNLSPHHFLRLFKEIFTITPYQMVIGRRLEKAKQMLLTGGSSVTDVCFDMGFESLGSFSRDFKRKFGVSPSQVKVGT